MGCCSSSEVEDRPPMNIGPPQDLMLNIPRPRVDAEGRPRRISSHELDRQTLESALDAMADFIRSRGQDITVVSISGAVNTKLLQTRQSTHDVDFFGTNINNQQRGLLDEAAFHAESVSRVPLGGDWFNNETMLWLPRDTHRELTRLAIEQNEVVYQRPGLKIVAAPWNYAFTAKVARVVTGTYRPYDPSDAADYLHFYVEKHGRRPVAESQVLAWARDFRRETSKAVLQQVNTEYKRRYSRDGIVEG